MRAGIAGFTQLPYHDLQQEPIVGATLPLPELGASRRPRLVKMLALSVREIMEQKPKIDWESIPLLVGLAEPQRPGAVPDLERSVVSEVQQLLGVTFHPKLSIVLPHSHVAGIAGLRLARELKQEQGIDRCLVCGVDSYLNAPALNWLQKLSRLKTENNVDGVIPGEAAAAVLIEHHVKSGMARVVGLGFADEKASILSEEPLQGVGLANAARMALQEAGVGFHELEFRLADITGESYGFTEHALAHARLMRVVRLKDHPLWHPADSIGDTGAAASVVLLVMAATAFAKQYAPGPRAACFASAVEGKRAVAVLTGAEKGTE